MGGSTPGPWTIGQHQQICSSGWSIRIPEDGSAIAYVLGEKNPEMMQNARLIAAAPELLEALQMALDWIDAVPQDTILPAMPGFNRDWMNDLLAKAKGK